MFWTYFCKYIFISIYYHLLITSGLQNILSVEFDSFSQESSQGKYYLPIYTYIYINKYMHTYLFGGIIAQENAKQYI